MKIDAAMLRTLDVVRKHTGGSLVLVSEDKGLRQCGRYILNRKVKTLSTPGRDETLIVPL